MTTPIAPIEPAQPGLADVQGRPLASDADIMSPTVQPNNSWDAMLKQLTPQPGLPAGEVEK